MIFMLQLYKTQALYALSYVLSHCEFKKKRNYQLDELNNDNLIKFVKEKIRNFLNKDKNS